MSDRERERFFSTACDYYIAGRFAAFAGLNPVVGNLLHHAIEMYLKGALAKTKSLRELDKGFKHDLPKLWEAFKDQTNDAALKRFDATIAELHRFERYSVSRFHSRQGDGSHRRDHAIEHPWRVQGTRRS
jgi:hypothetical protein